jgi:hypothetical protein
MDLMTRALSVDSRGDFAAFAQALSAAVAAHSVQIENESIPDFLDGTAAWVTDVNDRIYGDRGLPTDAAAWRLAARLLVAGLQYE